MTTVSDQVKAILEAMGGAADQVAATLRDRGIRGTRNTVRLLNPIVRYVGVALGLSSRGMDLMQPGILRVYLLDGTTVEAGLPSAIAEFLSAFDAGNYPDLESSP